MKYKTNIEVLTKNENVISEWYKKWICSFKVWTWRRSLDQNLEFDNEVLS